MPQVPRYDNFQVDQNVLPQTRLDAPPMQNAAPEQDRQMGGAMDQLGGVAQRIALDLSEQANQVRTIDALNQLRQAKQQLTFDTQSGYLALKGNAALERPDGKSLAQEYGDKLGQAYSQIAGSLGNDAQRRMFGEQAGSLMTQFNGELEQHTLQEFKQYQLSTLDGSQKLSANDALSNYSNPDKVQQSIGQGVAAVVASAQAQGLSANQTEVLRRAYVSGIHADVIKTALENQNPAYANGYLQQFKEQMTPGDILKVQGLVTHSVNSQMAMRAVSATTQAMVSQFEPSALDRLNNIVGEIDLPALNNAVRGKESNHQDFDKKGNPLTSSAGAKFAMQVMPATAKKPGFGIKPAQADTPEEYNRVGTELLGALVKKYGDCAQAVAAYNAGHGNVDKAMADAQKQGNPQNWLECLKKYQSPANHEQTVDYVQSIMGKMNRGGGVRPLPSEMEYVNDAVARLGPGANMEAVQMTQQAARQQYAMVRQDRAQKGEQATMQAQQELINNGGRFDQLSPQAASAMFQYAPGQYNALATFADNVANKVRTNKMDAYNLALSNPQMLKDLPDSAFLDFIAKNFTPGTQEQMVKMRNDLKSGKSDDTAQSINDTEIKRVLDNRLQTIGINISPKADDAKANQQLGVIRKYVRDSIFAEQKQTGKKMMPDEIDRKITRMFAQDTTVRGWFSDKSVFTMGMNVNQIPSATKENIRSKLVAAGVKNPTDEDIMTTYWNSKNGG